MPRVLVLGAGLQGICSALLLARRGHRVTLVERTAGPMLRASLRNEGKIHLGFIFVNDRSFATPSLMLRSALAFGPALEACVGGAVDWPALRSRPFSYAMPHDTMVAPDELCARYERLQALYDEHRRDGRGDYLGQRPERLFWDGRLLGGAFVRCVDTAEVALDMDALRRLLGAALEGTVEACYGHTVETVARTPAGFTASGRTADGVRWRRDADLVVNCTWDGRLALDRELGIVPRRKWVYRLKYRLLGELPAARADLPSLSIVLGPYGDVVVYPKNRIYVSWYPVCLRGWSTDLSPPSAWDVACDGRDDAATADEIRTAALAGIARLVPGLEESRIDTVDAGVIFSWGETDITDPDSVLHTRSDVGVAAHDGYFSIDPGKLTCAPMFAEELAATVGDA